LGDAFTEFSRISKKNVKRKKRGCIGKWTGMPRDPNLEEKDRKKKSTERDSQVERQKTNALLQVRDHVRDALRQECCL